jgi:hypothetical protein
MSDDYANIATNVILPFDPRRTKLLLGSLEYIAFEVVIAKIIRKIIKQDNKGWLHLGYIHALSLPFMGGAAGFFDPNTVYNGQDRQGKAIGFTKHLTDGAKGIPAVILAQWILESFTRGFHAPWFNMKDLLITAGTKAITRPAIGFVIDYLPKAAKENLMVVEELVARQQSASTLRSKK